MLYAPVEGRLEVRQNGDGSHTVAGRFPYGSTATISDGGRRGRPRKERFASRAFEHRVNDPEAEIHLLVGHDFGKPLASKQGGTMELEDADEALSFEARILREVAETSHGRDALALLAAGLAVGLSPGFRIPPERAVEDAETVEEEDPEEGDALIRTINAALLYELSIVTRPAYEESQVEARNWRTSSRVETSRIWPSCGPWRWR